MKTIILKTADNDIKKAAEIIKKGGLVVMPTETVYGLAVDALNSEAVEGVFKAKGRPSDNPLIVHVSDKEQLNIICEEVPLTAMKLADRFWPGPITLVLKKRSIIPDNVTGGLDTVAVRMPNNTTALKLIRYSGTPLAAPSANLSGRPSPTDFSMAFEDMDGRVDAIIEGKKCELGMESTVIDLTCTPAKILRPGLVALDKLKKVLGYKAVEYDKGLNIKAEGKVRSPGMKYRHYAPKAPMTVVLGTCYDVISYIKKVGEKCRVLTFEDYELNFKTEGLQYKTYGQYRDYLSQTRGLFAALNELDRENDDIPIIAMAPPTGTRFDVVRNRLYKAAGNNIINAGKMKLIGVTGGSGGGKTKMCDILRVRGYPVINADEIYRSITDKKCDLNDEIASNFGEQVLYADGSLNRKELAKIVLSDEKKLKLLNKITHPIVISEVNKIKKQYADSNAQICFLEAIALIESKLADQCDKIIFVNAPKDLRISRIMHRDKLNYEEARARVMAQPSESFYLKYANVVIMNKSGYHSLKRKILNLAITFEEEDI